MRPADCRRPWSGRPAGRFAVILALALGADGGAAPACEPGQPSAHCGRAPTTAFDRDGRLWAAFEFDGRIYIARASGEQDVFLSPVGVNADTEEIDVNGENRPKIAFGSGGEIYVSWTRKVPGGFNGEIRFSRSLDVGAGFEPVRTINDDGLLTGHRFETLLVDSDDNVYLVWIDKRDLVAATAAGAAYAGAAVYYAVSTDRGATFSTNRKIADHSCECCRIAAAEAPGGDVALFYRGIFGDNVRDHAFASVDTDGVTLPMRRATDDEWHIDACPHHGPALLSAGEGLFDLAWFTNGSTRSGLFYARFDARRGSLAGVTPVSAEASAGHPALARLPGVLLLVWKEFGGDETLVRLRKSGDGGKTWSAPTTLASTGRGSDHPLLITRGDRAWVSWHTADEGLRIVPAGTARGDGP